MDISISPISKEAPSVARTSGASGADVRREEPAVAAKSPADAFHVASEEQIRAQAEEANKALKASGERLQFEVHKGTNTILVRLVDDATQEVIKEYPSEKFLDMVVELQRIAGLRVDTTL